MNINKTSLLLLILILMFRLLPLYSQTNSEEYQYVSELIHWKLEKNFEVNSTMDGSLIDAGLFIGMKGCDVAASQDYHKVVVEVIDESGSQYATHEIEIFLKAFKKNINYMENYTKEVSYIINPEDPLCFMTRKEAFKKTGAELLISCKYLGSKTTISEYSGKHSGEVTLKSKHIGISDFRCLMMALSYSITDEKLLYIDEIIGKFSLLKEFIMENKKQILMYEEKTYNHFSGLSEIIDNYVPLGIVRYVNDTESNKPIDNKTKKIKKENKE